MTQIDKARLLGLFFWLFTILNVVIVVGIAVIYIAIFGVVFSQQPQRANDPPPELIIGILVAVFFFVLVITVLFSVPKLVAGYGLRKGKSWARGWAIGQTVAWSFGSGHQSRHVETARWLLEAGR